MIYSIEDKHIHIHNPKTGGESLMFMLSSSSNKWKHDYDMHLTFPTIQYHHKVFYSKIKNFTKSVTIRNPWAHAVSYYYHALDVDRFYRENFFGVENFCSLKHKEKSQIDCSFENFIQNYPRYSQENFCKETKNLKFDVFFKYEDWDEMIKYFVSNYRISFKKDYRQHDRKKIITVNNIKKISGYKSLYTTETKDRVAKISAGIIDKFGYEF